MSFWKVILPLAVMVIGGEFAVSKMMEKQKPTVELQAAPASTRPGEYTPRKTSHVIEVPLVPPYESGLGDDIMVALGKSAPLAPMQVVAKSESSVPEGGCGPVIGPELPPNYFRGILADLGNPAQFPTLQPCPVCH